MLKEYVIFATGLLLESNPFSQSELIWPAFRYLFEVGIDLPMRSSHPLQRHIISITTDTHYGCGGIRLAQTEQTAYFTSKTFLRGCL